MASNHALRQASRTIQRQVISSRSLKLGQPSSSSLYTSGPTFRTRPSQLSSVYAYQQSRNLSLWPFSKTPEQPTPSTSNNITITEPEALARTIKANDTSADLSWQSHKPNPLEPQILEDIQDKIAGTPTATPPLEDIPERIGYLHEVCGLDFGYGTTSIMMWVFEHLHIWGGLSWTGSIIALGLALRAVMIPLLVRQSIYSARMRAISPKLKPLQDQYTQAQSSNNMKLKQELALQMRALRAEHGVKFAPIFMPFLIQVPFGFGAWRMLRNAADLPVPGFVTETFYWLNDLTISDQYYILPFASSFLIFLTMRLARATNASDTTSDAMKIIGNVLPVMSFGFMIFQSGAVQLYFLASTSIGLVTSAVLNNHTFRRIVNLPRPDGGVYAPTGPAKPGPEAPKASFLRTRQDVATQKAQQQLATQEAERKAREAAAENQNISIIDKGVNKVKSSFASTTESFTKAMGTTKEDKIAERDRERSERYEAQARQRLEERRRERNENARR